MFLDRQIIFVIYCHYHNATSGLGYLQTKSRPQKMSAFSL